MFDCNLFLRRMNWGQKDLAERLEIGTSTVGMWCLGKSTPSYAVIEKLFRLGITPRELFGEEIDEIIKESYHSVDYAKAHQRDKAASTEERKPIDLDSPEFQAAVKSAIVDLKTKGLI